MYEFAEYSNYDGLWLAELVRNRKVKPFMRIGDERIRSSEEVMARICTVFFSSSSPPQRQPPSFRFARPGCGKSPAARAAVR
jgi:hypothetical protein